MKFFTTLSFCFLFLISFSQTTLNPGDIAITGFHVDDAVVSGNEEVKFVLLRDIDSGTEICFTDFGWETSQSSSGNGQSLQSPLPCGINSGAVSDGIVRWTATSNMTCGTQVMLYVKTSPTANQGSLAGEESTHNDNTLYMNMSSAGESIIAFQGTRTSPTLIAAGYTKGTTWESSLDECDYQPTRSAEPSTLSSNNYSWAFPHMDNGYYAGGFVCGDAAATRASIADENNWVFNNSAMDINPNLSVDFLEITAVQKQNSKSLIQWATASEQNNKLFWIEHSKDGREFEKVGEVSGAGTTNNQQDYEFLHNDPGFGNSYYRIRQVDVDETNTLSEVVHVFIKYDQPLNSFTSFPNPSENGQVNITWESTSTKQGQLTVMNTAGQLLIEQAVESLEGQNQLALNLQDYGKGIFIIRLNIGDQQYFDKLIIK